MEKKMNSKIHYFYVLWCKDNSFYGGYTVDLDRREKEHNLGVGAKYTRIKKRRPLKMIYAERFTGRSEAMSAEFHFKKLSRPKKEEYLKSQGVHFPLNKKNGCVIIEKR